jgi:hypothetical protein
MENAVLVFGMSFATSAPRENLTLSHHCLRVSSAAYTDSRGTYLRVCDFSGRQNKYACRIVDHRKRDAARHRNASTSGCQRLDPGATRCNLETSFLRVRTRALLSRLPCCVRISDTLFEPSASHSYAFVIATIKSSEEPKPRGSFLAFGRFGQPN